MKMNEQVREKREVCFCGFRVEEKGAVWCLCLSLLLARHLNFVKRNEKKRQRKSLQMREVFFIINNKTSYSTVLYLKFK